MTRDALNAITEQLRALPGGIPRTAEQAITAVDAYLTKAKDRPQDTVLRYEGSRTLELWSLLPDTLAALTTDPNATGASDVRIRSTEAA